MAPLVHGQKLQPADHFIAALSKPLPFKIAVTNPRYVREFPDIFTLGESEYGAVVDVWLQALVRSTSSESSAAAMHAMWQEVLQVLCNLHVAHHDKDATSMLCMRPEFTAFYRNTLVIKAVVQEASSPTYHSAIDELVRTFHSTAFWQFPKHCLSIPVVVMCSERISLHRIFHANGMFKQELVKDHSLTTLSGRRDFIVDIVKIATWIVSQTGPLESFHIWPAESARKPGMAIL